jgi:hypothetical protein
MNVVLEGTVKQVNQEEQITDNYKKKEAVVIIEESSSYPQPIICHAANTKISLLDNIIEGKKVKIHCNLKGKESKGKHYNSLEIWKIE